VTVRVLFAVAEQPLL
jgi:hypothetical protein